MDLARGFISVDDHLLEHPQVWTSRMSRTKWGERIPHVQRQSNGTDRWIIGEETLPLVGRGSAGACMADRCLEPERWEDVPGACGVPSERFRAMDADNVGYSALYPTVAGIAGETFGRLDDSELELACVQAYNDWLLEEWAAASNRFIPQCIVPISSVEATVTEVKRAVAKGHKGVILPAVPSHVNRSAPHINDPQYNSLWQTCQELNVPICFHAGASSRLELPTYEGYAPALAKAYQNIVRPAGSIPILSNFIVSRILERYPGLKVVFSDTSLGWITYVLETVDYSFDQVRAQQHHGYKLKPSEAFQRQCYVTGWYDNDNLRNACRLPGADNIMWATNFPLSTSTWPASDNVISAGFLGVPDGDRHKILWANAATLYGIL
jgi:predicted TIM-barrel fold metal-dependent hydrolase